LTKITFKVTVTILTGETGTRTLEPLRQTPNDGKSLLGL